VIVWSRVLGNTPVRYWSPRWRIGNRVALPQTRQQVASRIMGELREDTPIRPGDTIVRTATTRAREETRRGESREEVPDAPVDSVDDDGPSIG
jgi:hypothetical protein